LRDVLAVAPGDPVDGRVEVGADVLARDDVVPVPGGPAVVVPADLLQAEPGGVRERLRQPQHRGALRQRGGQVDDLHPAVGDGGEQLAEQGHRSSGRARGLVTISGVPRTNRRRVRSDGHPPQDGRYVPARSFRPGCRHPSTRTDRRRAITIGDEPRPHPPPRRSACAAGPGRSRSPPPPCPWPCPLRTRSRPAPPPPAPPPPSPPPSQAPAPTP